MTLKRLVSIERKIKLEMTSRILIVCTLAFLLIAGGNLACKKEAEEVAPEEEGTTAKEEGKIEFEGVVKVVVGKYMFIPKVQGFDIVVQGPLESGDTQTLIDKEVRGEGEFSLENPSVLMANSIDIKESEEEWRNVFTRSEEVTLDDYVDLKARDEFEVLKGLSYDKKKGWEGKEKAKIYGRLEKKIVTEGKEQKEIYNIVVLDEKDKELGKIVVDSFTDFALYYTRKLRLIDKFWLYITIKDTVDWKIRRRTKELFHADVLFTGLY